MHKAFKVCLLLTHLTKNSCTKPENFVVVGALDKKDIIENNKNRGLEEQKIRRQAYFVSEAYLQQLDLLTSGLLNSFYMEDFICWKL